MTDIPEGHGIIAGRGYENAVAALAAADAAGVSQSDVLAVDEGYLVPQAVLDAFHAALGGEAVENSVPDTVTDDPGFAAPPDDVPPLDGYSSPGPEEGSAALPESFEPIVEPHHGDGSPTSEWKNADIRDWASSHDVDLGEATTKADMLAAITAADTKEE